MYAKKSLGQHFLRCRWVISTLVHAAELKSTDTVLEIGPGTGILTRALARRAKKVIAVEKDEKLAEELRIRLADGNIKNVTIISGDILKVLPRAKLGTGYKVAANIPYYLTSRLLRVLLEQKQQPSLMVLTVQKEVAQRITAKPPHMNLLALSVQAYGKPEIIKTVPASCFWPKPRVDSAVIKIRLKTKVAGNDTKLRGLFTLARSAFGQKRKTLRRSLGIKDPDIRLKRPQELKLEDWFTLLVSVQKEHA
ncbi:MAG: ribosomal RNA small subunit methyltransferase A [Candidatus Sungiibacteriota bacterium]|uniref:Ribosomal RNA small subunit methyltransferase A n=1 Tax=Candidatus Sungiibacteriota bacterium TaxID=2750080 RepID=A0A7T5UPI2_9BACT|nr:MAG: ribosomal RNA small subunit methyltransferase A [Candidatus Sungbacteria bacterium]